MEGELCAGCQTCVCAESRCGVCNVAVAGLAAEGLGVSVSMHAADALKLQAEFANCV